MCTDSVEPGEPSLPEADEDTNVQTPTDPKAGGTRETKVKPKPKKRRAAGANTMTP